MNANSNHVLSRRAVFRNGALLLGATLLPKGLLADPAVAPAVKMGIVTDIHYSDKPASRTRFYSESRPKMSEAIDCFNRDKMECVVELGDLIDAGETPDQELSYLKTMQAELGRFNGPRHYVFGNHDACALTKPQFLESCGTDKSFYSFDKNGFHFVVLDGCFRQDGVAYGKRNFKWSDSEIPPDQRAWLADDLKKAAAPTVIFVHQRLDVENVYGVKSARAVRQILEDSKQVVAVFQGHSHKNDYHEIKGIHYCTLRAMVEGEGSENSGYSELAIYPDRSIKLQGFRKQTPRDWQA